MIIMNGRVVSRGMFRHPGIAMHRPDGIGGPGGGGGATPRSTFSKMTIHDVGVGFTGMRVLMRCDFNGAAKGGVITSRTRVDAALASITYALVQGASQVVLLSHNGRNEQIVDEGREAYTLAPLAEYLAEQLGEEVDFVRGFDQPLASAAKVVLMENTREDARDEAEDPAANRAYAQAIINAVSPHIYVLDGFSVAHRDQGSVTWPAILMKEVGLPAVAGRLLHDEYEFFIDRVINNPALPLLVFLGGAKVLGPGGVKEGGKIQIIEALLPTADRIVIGGAMALPFLLAEGFPVKAMDPFAGQEGRAASLREEQDIARGIMHGPHAHKVIVPRLVVGQGGQQIHLAIGQGVPEGFVMKDMSITGIVGGLRRVGYKTIFFNGTFGAYEEDKGGHVEGTNEVLQFMSQETARGALTIPGGGDTIKVLKALRKAEADEEFRFGFETTGGGASGNLIALGFQGRPEELPGFASLTDRK